MIIGITGSIGSGKTTASEMFRRHGFYVINADEIGHLLFKKNSDIYKKLLKEFGQEIMDEKKDVDRRKLGDMVFYDLNNLKKLNKIMHPAIISGIKNQVKEIQSKRKDEAKIVVDAPLLLETDAGKLVDEIIVVKSDEAVISERVSKKYQKDKIEKILKLQMPLDKKLEYADFVIDNNKDLDHLEGQGENIIGILEKHSKNNAQSK